MEQVLGLDERALVGDPALAEAGHGHDASAGAGAERVDPRAHPRLRRVERHEGHRAGLVPPHDGAGAAGEELDEAPGRPRHRGDRGDAQAFVDLGAARVVDAGDHPLHAEALPRDTGGDDVGVVAGGHGGEGVRARDAGLLEDPAVEAHAGEGAAAEAVG